MKDMCLNPEKILLENIFLLFEGEKFSKTRAAFIVGGDRKLENLIIEGKIDVIKKSEGRNSTWYCDAVQVLKNCRNMRKGTKMQNPT